MFECSAADEGMGRIDASGWKNNCCENEKQGLQLGGVAQLRDRLDKTRESSFVTRDSPAVLPCARSTMSL